MVYRTSVSSPAASPASVAGPGDRVSPPRPAGTVTVWSTDTYSGSVWPVSMDCRAAGSDGGAGRVSTVDQSPTDTVTSGAPGREPSCTCSCTVAGPARSFTTPTVAVGC